MENLKVGIAGLGRIGKIHLNNLLQMQNVDISAAMDPNDCLLYTSPSPRD